MAYLTAAAAAAVTSSFPPLPGSRRFPKLPFPSDSTSLIIVRPRSLPPAAMRAAASSSASKAAPIDNHNKKMKKTDGKRNEEVVVRVEKEEEEEEVEEELPWIQEKALDLVEFTGSVTQAIPGPRIGQTSFPWILALPLTYLGISFVIALVKTVNKFSSPRHKRRTLVNKNAMLCKSIDELFDKGGEGGGAGLPPSALNALSKKTGFTEDDILRKYIRYALNEKPFIPQLVANLIHLRRASSLDDSQVAEILNEISRRIVKEKGPVVMDLSGYTEKGFKRKLAVQALFGKVFYLSELPEFCSRDSSLVVKEIFGVTDEDSDKLRLHTLSEAGDMDWLEKMVDGSDSEDTNEKSSYAS